MKNEINIKVCGLTRWEQMAQLEELGVNYGGIILYEKSPRFAQGRLNADRVKRLQKIKKVGVFVNAGIEYILNQKERYGLDMAQLHGDESAELCMSLRQYLPVIKAFRIKEEKDLDDVERYTGACDYILFDAPGKLYGGNGTLFNWELLNSYRGATPFFLSGGIGLGEAGQVKAFSHTALHAVDINSRFETGPGEKNIDEIKNFLCHLNSD